MAGTAKTAKFLLSDATIMIGPQADVFDLIPANHSIGLTKAVRAEVTPGFIDLTQGVLNQVVYTVNNSMEAMISAEVYEYTARNLSYGAGIDASGADYDEFDTVLSLAAASSLTDSDTTIPLATGEGSNVAAGDFLVLQDGTTDKVAVIKVGSVTTDTVTIASGFGLPTGTTWTTAATRIHRVRKPIKVGTQSAAQYFGVKMVGILPENKKPITLIFPKCRITKGFNLAFDSQNFANLPFEFKPMALLPADPFYLEMPDNQNFMVLPG